VTAPAYDPKAGGVVMDLGFGPVVVDDALIRDIQDFCDRAHDVLMRTGQPVDRVKARTLRQLSFTLVDADIAMKEARADVPLKPIPALKPLTCQVVRLNPEIWGAPPHVDGFVTAAEALADTAVGEVLRESQS
jgi:hypothetical protein